MNLIECKNCKHNYGIRNIPQLICAECVYHNPLVNTSKKVEFNGNYTHAISQSTYDSHFRLRAKIKWNNSNQDIYFSEGL